MLAVGCSSFLRNASSFHFKDHCCPSFHTPVPDLSCAANQCVVKATSAGTFPPCGSVRSIRLGHWTLNRSSGLMCSSRRVKVTHLPGKYSIVSTSRNVQMVLMGEDCPLPSTSAAGNTTSQRCAWPGPRESPRCSDRVRLGYLLP